MTTKINLKEIERSAFRATFSDGLTDIFIGIVLLIFAIGPLLQDLGFGDFWSSIVFLPLFLIAHLIKQKIKRRIVEPRMGTVKFGPKRSRKIKMILAILSASLLLGILLGILFWFHNPHTPSEWLFPGFLSILLLLIFSGAAFVLDITRFYLYAFISSLGVISGELLFQKGHLSHHGYPVFFGVTCLVLITTGATLFIQFFEKYPKPNAEVSYE